MHLSRCVLLAFGIFLWPHRAIFIYGISHIVGSFLYVSLFYAFYHRILMQKRDTSSQLLVANFRSLFPTYKSFSMQVCHS